MKKRLQKEESADLPSASSRPVVYLKPKRQPKLEITPPKPIPKVPSQRQLVNLEKKYEYFDKAGYARAKDPQNDPSVLAIEVANGPFRRMLSRYKGDPVQLVELMITNAIRVEHSPKPEQAKKSKKVRKPKRPLTERQRQAADRAASRPSANTALAMTKKKGAPKTVPPKEKLSDQQIVEQALDECLTFTPELKLLFCTAFLKGEAKRQLRINEHIEQLVEQLKEELVFPRRVYTYLDVAIMALIPRYLDEQREIDQAALEKARARRQTRIAEARAKAERENAAYQARLHRNEPLTPRRMRTLNRA